MKYKVTKKFDKYRVGQVVDDKDIYIRRKIQEGGCLELYETKKSKTEQPKKEEKPEKKMVKESYENKAMDDKYENKGDNK